MIKFETINGTLCRMVEPEPLTEFSHMPCVIRRKQGILTDILTEYSTNPTMSILGKLFEVIGYPVEEGSKEWAVQRMKLGDKVTKRHLSHTYWQYDARPHLKCISEYNCGTLQIMVSPEIWLITAEPTGWQIYKEPKYKVGDWVEYRLDGDTYYGKICNIREYMYSLSVTTEEIPKDQARAIMLESIIRKLSPREVIVHIGCLSGTVRRINDIYFALNPSSKAGWVVPEANIPHAMLDTNTRSLVESLLEAMQEEK